MAEDQSHTEKVAEKATEKVTLTRAEMWLLRIAAATGVVSMLAHGATFLHDIGVM